MKNARKSNYTENVSKADAGGLDIMINENDQIRGYRQIRGIVEHELGIVMFNQYQQWPTYHWYSPKSEKRELNLYFIYNNTCYSRTWKAWYGEKTITQLANKFIEEKIGNQS